MNEVPSIVADLARLGATSWIGEEMQFAKRTSDESMETLTSALGSDIHEMKMKTKSVLLAGLLSLGVCVESFSATCYDAILDDVTVTLNLIDVWPSVAVTSKSRDPWVKGKPVIMTLDSAPSDAVSSWCNFTFGTKRSEAKIGNCEVIEALLVIKGEDCDCKGWKLVAQPTVSGSGLICDKLPTLLDPRTLPTNKAILKYDLYVTRTNGSVSYDLGTFMVGPIFTFSGRSTEGSDADGNHFYDRTFGSGQYNNGCSLSLEKELSDEVSKILASKASRPMEKRSATLLNKMGAIRGVYTGGMVYDQYMYDPEIKEARKTVEVPTGGQVVVYQNEPGAFIPNNRISGSMIFGTSKMEVRAKLK